MSQIRSAGSLGRADMARGSGLSVQAVSNIIASLEREGILIESGQRSRGRGLPAPQYALNPDGRYALGFEVQPDSTSVTVLNLMGDLCWSERQSLSGNDPETVRQQLHRQMLQVLENTGIDERLLLGAGIVMPGPFTPTGLANTSSVLPHWQDVDAQKLFSEALSIPVLVENDANAAAVGEHVSGCTHTLSNYAFIYFGTGVGLGIVHQGRLFRGGHGNAGELGHILVPEPACNTHQASDRIGTGMTPLENIASRRTLQQRLRAAGHKATTDIELDVLAASNDSQLQQWIHDASASLSYAVHVVENLFDPDTVVLGGALPDSVLTALVRGISLAEHSTAQRKDRLMPRVMQGHSGRFSAARGGAALVINGLFTPHSLS